MSEQPLGTIVVLVTFVVVALVLAAVIGPYLAAALTMPGLR